MWPVHQIAAVPVVFVLFFSSICVQNKMAPSYIIMITEYVIALDEASYFRYHWIIIFPGGDCTHVGLLTNDRNG